ERCDEFTPDSLKALSLWLTRNNSTRLDTKETTD
ncbi:NUDIX hydrolase, partial [Proteus mirabilis]